MLVDFAAVARKNSRADDWLLRTGGDEFLLALGNCSLERASVIAQRVIEECAASLVRIPDSARNEAEFVKYTVSIGLAFVDATDGLDEFSDSASIDLQAALVKADQELYRAKSGGKNRWCSSGSCVDA